MDTKPINAPPTTYLGHVKDGVIILDTQVVLAEGQAVRVEPVREVGPTSGSAERDQQLQAMKNIFTQWDEEDRSLTDEEAERLQIALACSRGLSLRVPEIQ